MAGVSSITTDALGMARWICLSLAGQMASIEYCAPLGSVAS